MAVKRRDKALLKQLKKQVRILQRKEAQNRQKLRSALKKMRKLGRVYKSKLASKMRTMQAKVAHTQASTYVKVAADIERQMLKNIEGKVKTLRTAIGRIEKKHISKLAKSIAKKGKKTGKVKAVRQPAKAKAAAAKSARTMRNSRKYSRQ